MAFTDLGSIASGGSSGNNQASLTIATTASCSAGELVVVAVSVDNRATGGGDDTATSGVTIGTSSPFALTKGRQNATNLAAQAGASVSLWWGILPNSVASGQNIVASFTTAASADATALSARHFSYTTGAVVSVEATNAGTATTTNPGSLNATTANLPCLRIRAIGCEYDTTQALTVTASWTAWAEGGSAATGTVTEQVIEAEHRISTGTGDASAPTLGSACDSASVYVAFKEVFTFAAADSSYALTGSAAGLTATTSVDNAPGWSNWFNPWGPKRPVADWVIGSSPSLLAPLIPPDTDNLPAGGANWFNPWGRKRPVADWFKGPTPTVPVTFAADSGSYALTGSSAGQAFGHAAGSGTYALTGSAAALALRHVAGAGSYTLTGSNAGQAFGFGAGAGTYAITGSAAALALGHVAAAGSYTITGSSAALALGLGAGTGSYTLTGADAGLVMPFTLTATSGNYSLTGASAAFVIPGVVDYLPAGMTGSYVPWGRRFPINLRSLTGRPLSVAPIVLTAAGGSYAITGSAISFVTATPGDTTNLPAGVTGWFYPWRRPYPVSLRTSVGRILPAAEAPVTLTAAAGSYTLTGSAAGLTVTAHFVLTAAASSYVLTGSSATLALGLTANSGSYTVSGSAAVLARGFAAGAGAYAITGTDAQLVQVGTITLTCGAGSYALTGGADVSFLSITPPTVEQPGGGYAGRVSGAGRGRMIRRRKRGELDLPPDLLPPPLEPSPPDLPPPAPGPKPPDLLPPQPGLMADMPMPQPKPLPPHVDEDEDEVALLLNLLS